MIRVILLNSVAFYQLGSCLSFWKPECFNALAADKKRDKPFENPTNEAADAEPFVCLKVHRPDTFLHYAYVHVAKVPCEILKWHPERSILVGHRLAGASNGVHDVSHPIFGSFVGVFSSPLPRAPWVSQLDDSLPTGSGSVKDGVRVPVHDSLVRGVFICFPVMTAACAHQHVVFEALADNFKHPGLVHHIHSWGLPHGSFGKFAWNVTASFPVNAVRAFAG